MEWLAFLGSIIGGLIGGLFTFLGVKKTIQHDKEKEERAEIARAKEQKPRLEIHNYLQFEDTKAISDNDSDCEVLVLHINDFKEDDKRAKFYYDKEALDPSKLCFIEYTLKNTGLTEISDVCLTSNLQRDTAVFALETADCYVNNNMLNYDVWSHKKHIKPGESFKLRVYYIDNKIVLSNLGTPVLSLWLMDINDRCWRQMLNSPYCDIGDPEYTSYSVFRNIVDIRTAIECFKKPYLW